MRGKIGREAGSAQHNASSGKACAKLLQRATDALLCGVVGGAECQSDLAQAAVFKKAQEQGVAVRFIEGAQRLIQQRLDGVPFRGSGIHGGEFGGGLFARDTTLLRAHEVYGGAAGHDVEPCHQWLGG